ncbi:MAG: folate-binding protein YgfZ [Planctomycetota bacterium]
MKATDALTAGLLAEGPWVRSPAPYRLVRVAGPDAADFLQRLCSQDVLALAPGAVAPAAFLDGKGKLLATCVVGRLGDADGFALETQAHQQAGLHALLDRFHFTEQLQLSAPDLVCVERVTAAAAAGPAEAPDGVAVDGVVTHFAWARRGVRFERWHAADAAALPAAQGRALDDDTATALRMGAGLVAVGADTEPTTLALEAHLDDHCSRTKGCYTGQEIVARIHTYGHTNRNLVLLHLDAGAPIIAPAVLHECEDDLPVGRVMRAVPVPGRDLRVGLGYLPRDFQPVGTKLRLAGGGGGAVVVGFGDDA